MKIGGWLEIKTPEEAFQVAYRFIPLYPLLIGIAVAVPILKARMAVGNWFDGVQARRARRCNRG